QQADQAADVKMDLSVQPDPPGVGPADLVVSLADAQGQPIEDARLAVKGDMSHAGMVPVLAEIEGGAMGRYTVPFEWTMSGDWIVTVSAALPDGRTATRQFHLNVAGDMAGTHGRTHP